MPPSKPKPSEIAAEAKKTYIPYIRHNFSTQWPPTSFLCHSESMIATPLANEQLQPGQLRPPVRTCRFAFYERDPVDLALDWGVGEEKPIPVIIAANDKRPGGDWEAGVMSPEECLCRRSNLYAALTTPAAGNSAASNYPIPLKAGIYSQKVVIFRNGPDKYEAWQDYKTLPIISVCPVKRPKLDTTGKKYSFKQEKELMKEKIRTALRIAIYYEYDRLCIGTFGLGPGFRNPVEEVALMWRDILLQEPEFRGQFQDIVFAFEAPEGPETTIFSPTSKGSSSKSSSSKSSSSKNPSSSSSKSTISADLEVFKYIFKPSVIHDAFKIPVAHGYTPTPQEY